MHPKDHKYLFSQIFLDECKKTGKLITLEPDMRNRIKNYVSYYGLGPNNTITKMIVLQDKENFYYNGIQPDGREVHLCPEWFKINVGNVNEDWYEKYVVRREVIGKAVDLLQGKSKRMCKDTPIGIQSMKLEFHHPPNAPFCSIGCLISVFGYIGDERGVQVCRKYVEEENNNVSESSKLKKMITKCKYIVTNVKAPAFRMSKLIHLLSYAQKFEIKKPVFVVIATVHRVCLFNNFIFDSSYEHALEANEINYSLCAGNVPFDEIMISDVFTISPSKKVAKKLHFLF
jgi:hypothetical protein